MKHFQDVIFVWIRTYSEIFKSALEYLSDSLKKEHFFEKNIFKKWRRYIKFDEKYEILKQYKYT